MVHTESMIMAARILVSLVLMFALWCDLPLAFASAGDLRDVFLDQSGVHATIEITGRFDQGDEAIKRYVSQAVQAVVSYYGHFPIKTLLVQVRATDDYAVGFGSATHDDEGDFGLIEIDIGSHTAPRELDNSWTLTHEMMHLAFPVMPRQRRWLAEGIATYIEPIGRLRTGKVSSEQLWGELYDNSWRALPRAGEGGLNATGSLSRIYWGGALYCLLADLRIRQRTGNKYGLEDALRAIADGGGTAASQWTAKQALEAGDRAVGGTVLLDLYDEMAVKEARIDLAKLWSDLGVARINGKIALSDQAPLAAFRHAIEQPNKLKVRRTAARSALPL